MNNNIQFGSINVETGESQEGYIENGQMKFKPMKWWQKLFFKKPEEKEFIGSYKYETKFPWSKQCVKRQIAMYKYFNPYTGKIYKIEGSDGEETIQLDVGAFQNGQIIPIRQ
jgi:hypothetical protein